MKSAVLVGTFVIVAGLVTAARQSAQPDGGWASIGGDAANQRYTRLTQITPQNVVNCSTPNCHCTIGSDSTSTPPSTAGVNVSPTRFSSRHATSPFSIRTASR